MVQEKTEVQQFKYNRYLAYFLLFSVASSKKIIIYNEELLVALSFVLFFYFSLNYFGSTVQDSLDSTSSSIQFELENYYRLKEESLKQLLLEYKGITILKNVFGSMQNKLSFFVDLEYQVFYNRFSRLVKSKVISFKSLNVLFLNMFQKSILVSTFPQIVFNQLSKTEQYGARGAGQKSESRSIIGKTKDNDSINNIQSETIISPTDQQISEKRGPGRPKGSRKKNAK